MNYIVWKKNYFKYADVSMLSHVYGVSYFTQFYDRIEKNQVLPRPCVGSNEGEKVNFF